MVDGGSGIPCVSNEALLGVRRQFVTWQRAQGADLDCAPAWANMLLAQQHVS